MITLVGHGYIGQAIAHRLQHLGITFAWLRHNAASFPSGPIINAAGYIGDPNVDACEDKKAETMEGNVFWPLKCESMAGDTPVIHVTSGCVYNGPHPEGGFSEEDTPNFTGSFYSYSKVAQQKALAQYMGKSYLLRMRMPFSGEEHPKNLLTKFRQYPTLVNGANSLSRTEDVAKTAVWFAQNLPKAGIYNLVNPGAIENREIADLMGVSKKWISQDEFRAQVKAPRSFCVLNSDKLQSIFPLDDVRTALRDCIETKALEAA